MCLPQQMRQFTRMKNVKNSHCHKDQYSIKDIQKYLVMQKKPIVSLNILHQAEHRSHHNQEASRIQHIQVLSPRDGRVVAPWDRVFLQLQVEATRCNYKEAEKEDLDEKSHHNDLFAQFHVV